MRGFIVPRFRNLFDYSTKDTVHRPHETLVDVPITDSVNVITINMEDGGYVQLRRIEGDGPNDWAVITDLPVTRQERQGAAPYQR